MEDTNPSCLIVSRLSKVFDVHKVVSFLVFYHQNKVFFKPIKENNMRFLASSKKLDVKNTNSEPIPSKIN